jgi:glycosyltransferase involved in cell wall biosynthesis
MFVPFYNKLLLRGNITQPLLFPVQQLQFKRTTFTPEIISRRLRKAVDCFDPDYVIIGDGWSLKPYVVRAFQGYKTFLRFYAYENLCLIRNGLFLKDGSKCSYNFLRDREKCLECFNEEIIKKGAKEEGFKEFLLSRGLTKEFHGLVTQSLRRVYGIIVSNSAIAKMLSPLNKNIHIIPGGVDIDKFSDSGMKKSERHRKNILMTGRVDDYAKGLDVLMAASKKLWLKRKDFIVNVTSRKKIDQPFIKSTGWVPFDRLPRLYKQADICVFPSIWPEPFGLVVVEAMAAGRPVIASKVGGLKQVVVDKETGFLVMPGDADDLAQKLEILLDNSNLRNKMGQKARERVEEKYDWRDIIKKYYLPLFTP